jgi:PTH1 family peptidyl-tRNA hydrolase
MKRLGQVLIVGLGNPGVAYEATRHNVGFMSVQAIGENLGWTFKKDPEVKGKVAHGKIGELDVGLLLPFTYMNNSGLSVKRALELYGVEVGGLLVVVDDIHIPFGDFRLREKGSSGGHNGLKSIEAHLVTNQYYRLKVGIGNRFIGLLEEYVLSDFSVSEKVHIKEILKNSNTIVESWLQGDIEQAKKLASSFTLNIEGEKNDRNL